MLLAEYLHPVERCVMPVKVKIVSSKPEKVAVKVRRPAWQQFIHY